MLPIGSAGGTVLSWLQEQSAGTAAIGSQAMNAETLIAGFSAAVATAGAIVSYYAFHRTIRSSARPVLIFSMTADYRWKIENVGTGPAINVVIADRHKTGDLESITNCFPIAAGAFLALPWITAGWELIAVYTDVFNGKFTSICQGNRNRVVKRDLFPHWKTDKHQWLQLILSEGKEESHLTTDDLKGKSATELEIMRNSIFARRGLIFTREDLAEYFSRQPWYTPVTRDAAAVHRQISPAERYEAFLILDFQNRHQLRAVPLAGLPQAPGEGAEDQGWGG